MRADPPPECSAPLLRIGKTMKMALIKNSGDADDDGMMMMMMMTMMIEMLMIMM